MKILSTIIVCVAVLSLGGCNQNLTLKYRNIKKAVTKKGKAVESPVIAVGIQDVKLAEVILRGKPYKISIATDPFEPLLKEKMVADLGHLADGHTISEAQALKDLQYLGMIRIFDEVSVLMNTSKGKNTFKLNDQVDELTIVDITSEFITLKNETASYKLKRGVL